MSFGPSSWSQSEVWNALWGVSSSSLVATITSTAESLLPGSLVSSITNYATITDVDNYTPTADSAAIQVNGVAATGGTVLADGDVVTLLVTADGFPDFTFTIDGNVGDVWILSSGTWDDDGFWDDTAVWNDAA